MTGRYDTTSYIDALDWLEAQEVLKEFDTGTIDLDAEWQQIINKVVRYE